MIVEESMVTRWLRSAKAGETIVYARSTFLNPKSKVAAMLRQAAADGHVVLYRERRTHGPGDENFRYIARRTARPLPGQVLEVRGVRPLGAAKAMAGGAAAAAKVQDRRYGACASLQREIAQPVREMIAEGERDCAAIARALGLYSSWPVYSLMRRERMAA